MIEPKEIQILSQVIKTSSYSNKESSWSMYKSSHLDTFISNASPGEPQVGKIFINILYQGNTKDVPVELLDKLLCRGDSSYNPMRPFRWYRSAVDFQLCAQTDTKGSVEKIRQESFDSFLSKIDNPEKIWIYEMGLV